MDKILFSLYGWDTTGWTLLWLMPLYLFFGFCFSKLVWYIKLRIIYRREVESYTCKFLESKNIGKKSIPEELRVEWGEYFHSVRLVKPKPETIFICLTWPIWIIFGILYFAVLWPIGKVLRGFTGIDEWIESKALKDFDEQLPDEKDREANEERIRKEELNKLKKDMPPKTIGPKKT